MRMAMRPYLLSLAVGMLVGVAYAALRVRSPAPPVVALVGLLGMLAGEQLVPLIRGTVAARYKSGTMLETVPPVSGGLVDEEHEALPAKQP
jgi:XapX domain-containing protein